MKKTPDESVPFLFFFFFLLFDEAKWNVSDMHDDDKEPGIGGGGGIPTICAALDVQIRSLSSFLFCFLRQPFVPFLLFELLLYSSC